VSSELDELQRRLANEPSNLGLRVAYAGALLDAGRHADAVELYRSVAIAYRQQGRTQQAIAVCHSILEISPDDPISRGLLAAYGEPERRSSPTFAGDATPLPAPVPYHVADPTARLRKQSEPSLGGQVEKISDRDLTTTPVRLVESIDSLSDIVTPYTREDVSRDTDRELPEMTNPNLTIQSTSERIISGALFSSIPPQHRAGVFARFRTHEVKAGTTVIRQGETDHPLIVVGHGELAVRVSRGSEVVMIHDAADGEHVGEGSLLARAPSPVHVVAVIDSELLLLSPRELYEVAGAFPALWARLKDVAEKRAREMRKKLA
jgi:CRP-like cAMP-binding protein